MREAIMTALAAQITNGIASGFTGDTVADNKQITGIASTARLFAGLPVVGGAVPDGAFIASIDSANAVTVTEAPTEDGSAIAFLTGFRQVGRRVQPWSKTTCPALFLLTADEDREVRSPLPPKRTLGVELIVYSDAGKNTDFAPGIALNNFVDAIEAALAPSPITNVQTLGGLVTHARIEGKIEFYPGDIGSQAKVLIPVKILIP